MKRPCPASHRSQSGSTTVELALVMVPLVLLLMTVTADLGRAFYSYNTLVKAARGATRYLALANPPDATAQTQARNLVLYGDVSATGTLLVPDLKASMIKICTPALCADHNAVSISSGAGTMNLVSVSISYTYKSLFSAALPASITFPLIGVTMRCLP